MKIHQFKKQFKEYKRSRPSQNKIPPLEKHKNHQVEIRPGVGKHLAQYWCLDCNKWIAWVSKKDYAAAKELGLV